METKFLIGNPVLNNHITGTTLNKTAKELGLRCDTTLEQCQLDSLAVPVYVSSENTVINLFEFAYLKSISKYHPNTLIRVIKIAREYEEMVDMVDRLITPIQLVKIGKLTAALAEINGSPKKEKISKPDLHKQFGAPLMNAAFNNKTQYQSDKHMLRKFLGLLPCTQITMEHLVIVVNCYSKGALDKIKELANCTKKATRRVTNSTGGKGTVMKPTKLGDEIETNYTSENDVHIRKARETAPVSPKDKTLLDKPLGHRTPPKAKLRANQLAPHKAPLRQTGGGSEVGSLFDADN